MRSKQVSVEAGRQQVRVGMHISGTRISDGNINQEEIPQA
jgi:hypothetical protein